MGSVKVAVYGRIKPCDKQPQEYRLKYGDHEDQVIFGGSKTAGKKIFRFRKIFGEDATQEQMFDVVAKPVIKSVFAGYNGTIFTYGQTGSGKTYTMTGEFDNRGVNAGLIPRTIQEIFKLKKHNTFISISFCEIYNEHIYDLIRIDPASSDLGGISLLEVNTGITHFRNLSVHVVSTAQEAIQLFLRGDSNKMVAETGSNVRSSRSHVIFSIGLELPHPTEENLCLKPVLYLVDLAGSEKLSKCKTPMTNPNETRYINLSLHYLEQVLIALRQPGRMHIPYRNSLMTALLRNSLGGNSITVMIATFSVCIEDADETIQTCRFAERIALIKNEVKLSELASPEKEIDALRKENERLRAQLRLLCNEQVVELLTDKEKEKCAEMVQNFIRDNDYFDLPLTSVRRMEYCFKIMRDQILKKGNLGEFEYRTQKNALDFLEATDSKELQLEQKLAQENKGMNKKNSRRKRNPLDIPKVNITYKRWKSTELISEKENEIPKRLTGMLEINKDESTLQEVNQGREDRNFRIKPLIKKTSFHETPDKDTYLSGSFLRERDFTPKLRSSNLNFKFPGETNMKNDNTTNNLIKSEFCVPTISVPEQNPSDERLSCTADKDSNNLGKLDIIDLKSYDDKYSDQISCNSNTSAEFSTQNVPLTGDKEVDEEIIKFYKSRYQLFKNS